MDSGHFSGVVAHLSALEALEGDYPQADPAEKARDICTSLRKRFNVKANTAGVPVY